MITYHLKLLRGRTWILTREDGKCPVQTYRDATLRTALDNAAAYVACTGGHLRIYHRNGLFGSEQFFETPTGAKHGNLELSTRTTPQARN